MPADKILIVEDEIEVAQALDGYLKRLGYRVAGIVDNGEEALDLVAQARPDLALMDIEIQGGMDGIELAERFRKHDIPVIFLTGRSDDVTLDRVRRSESFGYLVKPFRLVDLKAGIELALIRHGHEAHLKQIEQSFSAAIMSTGDAILMADQAGAVSFPRRSGSPVGRSEKRSARGWAPCSRPWAMTARPNGGFVPRRETRLCTRRVC